ncbi:MAG TPA: S-methyl-5-thioribose-1-phosphate isomerase [Candidatus Baltobacteraceae bacterium]|jgi:methylthioribose-1-phosphate isomerase|nr:S-methyl-5-thioribose-1-phosphate isomerase [Candidatus Baltobacteraceae bacterium]
MDTVVRWTGDAVEYIDQRLLPHQEVVRRASTLDEIESAIQTLAVRGAPCIGVFGAYGVALLRSRISDDQTFAAAAQRIRNARPTAVNLMWAVDRVLQAPDMIAQAKAIHAEQIAIDARIGEAGAELVPAGARILTHCNTGPLATAGGGTALGVILAAARAGKHPHVFVDETRPLLQGARLTYYELTRAGIQATLIVDAAAAITMQRARIDLVIVGADRVAANGDTANKIGTYGLAIMAAHHGIPFYVAAPRSTFDFSLRSGAEIPIEERPASEVTTFGAVAIAPEGARAFNPAFDVTPGHLITAFITEYGVTRPPYPDSVPDLQTRPNLLMTA